MSDLINVKIKRLHKDAVIPQYARDGDAGFDLIAVEDAIIEPGETAIIPTGLAFELPQGYEMHIRPRSGITVKTKLRVQLGTVDAGYRGEVGVIVDNDARDLMDVDYYSIYKCDEGHGAYVIRKGDRIAQAVINRIPTVQITEVDELRESERGEGGFGSSGVRGG